MNAENNRPFGLPEHAVDQLVNLFSQYKSIHRVIIYGSRATGNYRPGSDIDLCIDADQMNLTQLLKIENQIDDLLLPWKIDLSLKHSIDNPNLLQHINDVGVVFYAAPVPPV